MVKAQKDQPHPKSKVRVPQVASSISATAAKIFLYFCKTHRLTFCLIPTDSQHNNDLMRQMQHQLAVHQAGILQQQEQQNNSTGLGQLQNFNANVLMNAFQPTAPPSQNQLQGAENILASVLAAANVNAQSQTASTTTNNSTQQSPQIQSATLSGLPGMEQFPNLNQAALQQAAASQQHQPNFQQFQQQQHMNGLQSLQQQLANLQQQLGTNQQHHTMQQQTIPQQSQTPQPQQQQVQQQHNIPVQAIQQQFAQQFSQQQQQLHQQQQIPTWMGPMGPNLNVSAFNPASLQQLAGAFHGADVNVFQQEVNQLQSLPTQQNTGFQTLGMGATNPTAFQFQQQLQQQFPQPAMAQHLQQQQQQQQQQQVSTTQQQALLGKGFSTSLPQGSDLNHTKLAGFSAMMDEENLLDIPNKMKKSHSDKKKRAKSFPEKLMQAMMEYGDEEAVAWLPDGKSFVIVNPDLFCNEILSKVFKESKYASFVRKLHRYGSACQHEEIQQACQFVLTTVYLLDGGLFD